MYSAPNDNTHWHIVGKWDGWDGSGISLNPNLDGLRTTKALIDEECAHIAHAMLAAAGPERLQVFVNTIIF